MHIFVHPLYETLWYAGFRTVFVLVVSSKLSWVRTFEVFVPQNGLNVLYPGPKQLWQGSIFFFPFLCQLFLGNIEEEEKSKEKMILEDL